MVEQKVVLLDHPNDLLRNIYVACRTCYSSEDPADIWNSLLYRNGDPYTFDFKNDLEKSRSEHEKMLKLVKKVINSDHLSTVEHGDFVFAISGVSRAFSHQFVRTRHGSFSQKSQRYCKEDQFEYIIPDSIKNTKTSDYSDGRTWELYYNNLMVDIQDVYNGMLGDGIPAEDARFVLPNATATSFIATFNIRSIMHTAEHRLCKNAQWEYRQVFQKMCDEIIGVEPWLKEFLNPVCVKNGYCSEMKSCGRYPKK